MQDEVEIYAQSLIDGTEYAKVKDGEAKLRRIAQHYGVSVEDAMSIQAAVLKRIEWLIAEYMESNKDEIVKVFVKLCQPPPPAGATDAEPLLPTMQPSARRAMPEGKATLPQAGR